MAQKITPNLWFDGNAKEAVDFYTEVFPKSKITATTNYPNSAEEGLADFQLDMAGKVLTVSFNLSGHDFVAINAGPQFKPTPALSFMINFDPSRDEKARELLDEVWNKLSAGGEVMMKLGEYPFSKRYGWVKDKYGFTWQLILTNPEGEERPTIIPNLMFSGDLANKAEEAMNFYTTVFQDSKVGTVARYEQDQAPVKIGGIMFADFNLAGEWMAIMDAPGVHDFKFNEAISLSIACKDQSEIDYFWEKLSVVPESEQCGWCKDKYGVSWQVVPENTEELLKKPDAFAHLMQMKKIVIADF